MRKQKTKLQNAEGEEYYLWKNFCQFVKGSNCNLFHSLTSEISFKCIFKIQVLQSITLLETNYPRESLGFASPGAGSSTSPLLWTSSHILGGTIIRAVGRVIWYCHAPSTMFCPHTASSPHQASSLEWSYLSPERLCGLPKPVGLQWDF